MTQQGQGKTDRFVPAYRDSFGFLRTALVGVTTWTDRQIRNTGIVVPHINKNDIFSYNVQINHDKKLGTALADFHIHFMPVGEAQGGEVIAIDYAWGFYSVTETIPDTLPNTGTAQIPLLFGDQYKHKFAEIVTNLSVGNETYSGFLLIKCQRRNDAQDTYGSEIALLGADSHYISDRAGSYLVMGD